MPPPAAPPHQQNLAAALLVTLAMAIFTFEDYVIKDLALTVPSGLLLIFGGLTGSTCMLAWAFARRLPPLTRRLRHPAVVLRTLAEFLTALVGMAALTGNPLSLHSAIFQATPLVVTILAIFWLGERAGPGRIAATLTGFFGVVLIIGPERGLTPAILFSLLSVLGVAIRDIATRSIPAEIESRELILLSYLSVMPAGLLTLVLFGQDFALPTVPGALIFVLATLIGLAGGFALTIGIRRGEASFVAPFRYTRIIFAMLAGVFLLGEEVDRGMIAGSVLLIVAGLIVLKSAPRPPVAAPFLDPAPPL